MTESAIRIEETYEEARRADELPGHDLLLMPSGGTTIEEVAEKAVTLSHETDSIVLLLFNGIAMTILPYDDSESVVSDFYKIASI